MTAFNDTRQTVIAENITQAKTLIARTKGLLGKKNFDGQGGLLLFHCRAVHMFFMRFAIDVLFLSRDGVVVGRAKSLRPFSLSPFFFKAFYALELPEGAVEKSRTRKGDKVVFQTGKD